MVFSFESFVSGLKKIEAFDANVVDDCVVLSSESREIGQEDSKDMIVAELSISEIEHILKQLGDSDSFQESIFFRDSSIEAAVQVIDFQRPLPFRPDRVLYETKDHDINFEFSKASTIYLLALICNSSSNSSIKLDVWFSHYRFISDSIHKLSDFFDLFRIFTIKISSEKTISSKVYRRMLYSYMFNISYNHSIALSISNLSESRSRTRWRARRNGQLFPYKAYDQRLTKYYYQAVATDIPIAQYLAFYHVAEFFFQSISEEETFAEIAEFITKPSFSPYAKNDIKRFYHMIRGKIREQRDDGVWNEKKGLLLCLQKFVPNLASLKDAIQVTDSSAVDYYKGNLVEFADDSKKINFDDNEEIIYTNIRDRIYSTRNAIVHSKEGEKLRYEPFIHDKQLYREIPLIRCVAEEIIINSASKIEIEQTE